MAEQLQAGPRPAIDPELVGTLTALRAAIPGGIPPLGADNLAVIRAGFPGIPTPPAEHFSRGAAFEVRETAAPGRAGAPDVPVLICRPRTGAVRGCIVNIHGGGMVLGSHVNGVDELLDYAHDLQLAVASVDYRLAPENPYPAPVEDCVTAAHWLIGQQDELGIEPGRLVLAGESAGGGLAAATALMARDRGMPGIIGQLLIAPMLDHRSRTPSMLSLRDAGMWDRESNLFGWAALLGEIAEADVPSYASPAVANDLSGLPATFIDVGGADAFRDEAIDYATRLSQAGTLVDLHVWAGAYHGFDGMTPDARVSRAARAARRSWLDRVFAAASTTH